MNKKMMYGLPAAMLLAGSLVLSGCGGSSESEKEPTKTELKDTDPTDTDPTTEVTTDTTVTGSAVDGYLRNAFVCLDENANNECDDGEAYIKSSSDGSYTLKLPATIPTGATVLAVGGVDNATGKNFTGLLKAPMDKSAATINITPLTTMVTAQIQAEGGDTTDGAKIQAAVKKVADTLGLDATKVTSDPVKEGGDVEKKALQIQKVIEVMTEAEKTSNDSSNVAGAIDKVTKALAKQFSGTQSDVAAIATAVATDTTSGLERAGTVAAVAAAVATEIAEAADTEDVQAVADIVATAVKTQVEAAKTVDATSGAVTIGNVDATSVATIDTSSTAVMTANIERLMNLVGYQGDAGALATALANANITSDTTLEGFLVTVQAMDDSTMKTELLAALDQALVIEDSFGETVDTSLVIGKSMYQLAAERRWDDSLKVDVPYIVTSRLTFTNEGTITFADESFSLASDNWVPRERGGEDQNYYWTGEKWCEGNTSGETTTFTTSDDGAIEGINHIPLICDGADVDLVGSPFVLRVGAENDIANSTKAVAPRNWGLAITPFDVTFGADAKEYILNVTNSDDMPLVETWNRLAFDQDAGYTSFADMANDAKTNGNTIAQRDGYSLEFAYINSDGTEGTLKEQQCDDNHQNCTETSSFAGTWEVKTTNGLEIMYIYPANLNRYELGEAFVLKDGKVEHAWIRGMDTGEQIMFFYNEEAMESIKTTIQNSTALKALVDDVSAPVEDNSTSTDNTTSTDDGSTTALVATSSGTVTLDGGTYNPQRVMINMNDSTPAQLQINIKEFDGGNEADDGRALQMTTGYASKADFDAAFSSGTLTLSNQSYMINTGSGWSGRQIATSTFTKNSNGTYNFTASGDGLELSVENVWFDCHHDDGDGSLTEGYCVGQYVSTLTSNPYTGAALTWQESDLSGKTFWRVAFHEDGTRQAQGKVTFNSDYSLNYVNFKGEGGTFTWSLAENNDILYVRGTGYLEVLSSWEEYSGMVYEKARLYENRDEAISFLGGSDRAFLLPE